MGMGDSAFLGLSSKRCFGVEMYGIGKFCVLLYLSVLWKPIRSAGGITLQDRVS